MTGKKLDLMASSGLNLIKDTLSLTIMPKFHDLKIFNIVL
jgi:hypothetical protein